MEYPGVHNVNMVALPLRKWTRDEYRKAAEVGIIRPEERLELLGTRIVKPAPGVTDYLVPHSQMPYAILSGNGVPDCLKANSIWPR